MRYSTVRLFVCGERKREVPVSMNRPDGRHVRQLHRCVGWSIREVMLWVPCDT